MKRVLDDGDEAIEEVLDLIRHELTQATYDYPPFNSAHEGFAVLKEEVDELWDEVKSNNTERAREEAIQVAAMAARFLVDL